MDKIVTYYDAMDRLWIAYREAGQDDAEETLYGCGASEAAAIGDLHDKLVMGG